MRLISDLYIHALRICVGGANEIEITINSAVGITDVFALISFSFGSKTHGLEHVFSDLDAGPTEVAISHRSRLFIEITIGQGLELTCLQERNRSPRSVRHIPPALRASGDPLGYDSHAQWRHDKGV